MSGRRRRADRRALRRGRAALTALAACALVAAAHASADEPAPTPTPTPNPTPSPTAPLPGGFPADGLAVDRARIVAGGPRRDGIRSVDSPRFVAAPDAARWVGGGHAVVGLALGGEARAYPVHLLEHHQVVNDRIGDVGIVVTYDPLIDVARAFEVPGAKRATDGRGRFGVSGLIHRCNFVLYDRSDDSLWAQWDGRALTGARSGERLRRLRVRVESLRRFARRHPAVRVLRPPDPEHVDYGRSRYTSYWVSDSVPFPLDHVDARIHPKELVLGARVGDHTRAYLASVVERRGGRIVDELAGHRIRVEWEPASGTFGFEAPEEVELTSAFWFAWKNFHPETELWNVELEPMVEQDAL